MENQENKEIKVVWVLAHTKENKAYDYLSIRCGEEEVKRVFMSPQEKTILKLLGCTYNEVQ